MMHYKRTHAGFDRVMSVAPMMDWTDRHCRYFHRLLTRHTLLYTEMVVADALIHGDVERHLEFHESEHPVALQIGGSTPEKVAGAARLGEQWGYDEINLNVGCPSDRVQSGVFGACLMREPKLVAECVGAMKEAVNVPVTVKCRLGVDDQDPELALDLLADTVLASGCDALWVHARKAWLQGLSPKENRDVPPLDYGRVARLKARLSNTFVGINGGITRVETARDLLQWVDGVMIGRAAYHGPAILRDFDDIVGHQSEIVSDREVIGTMASYVDRHVARGGRASNVTRHMLGLFAGRPGARAFRRHLSTEAVRTGVDGDVLREAAGFVLERPKLAA